MSANMVRDAERVWTALDGFQIEVPSWGFANTGTRFGKFLQSGAATTIDEKFADAAHLARMPFGDRLQHIIRVVAVRAFQQLARIDHDHLMACAVSHEDAFQAHMVVPWMVMFIQRHVPDRLGRGRRGCGR